MAAAEGGGPIKQRQSDSASRRPVVDRCSTVKSDVSHDPRRARDETPLPELSDGSGSGQNNGLAEVVFRVTMVALAEEEGFTAAVGDVQQANAAVNVEDAVPGYAGKRQRARAGVAAITTHPIETPGPLRGGRC
jgi:hypothetical protein